MIRWTTARASIAGRSPRADASYFSQLKRPLDGTQHHVSKQRLDRYVSEFDHRYNTRKMSDGKRTELAIQKAAGKRLV